MIGLLGGHMIHFFWKLMWKMKALFIPKGVKTGSMIPNFHLQGLENQNVSLYEFFPEKAVMLWITNLCSSCQEKIAFLNRLYKEYEKFVQMIAISTLGNDRNTPALVVEKYHPLFSLLLDPDDWVSNILGFKHAPDSCPLHNFLVMDRSGRVIYLGHLSAVREDKLEKMIRFNIASQKFQAKHSPFPA